MIVKVQLTLATTTGARQMLVYDRDKTLVYEDTASREVLSLMVDEDKAFFTAEVRHEILHLGARVPDPGW